MGDLVVTRNEAGKVILRAPGESTFLHLSEIPTTGYLWHVQVGRGLEVLSSRYEPAPAVKVGGGGTRIFDIRAMYPATAEVVALLRRSWEAEGVGIDQVSFTIEVRDEAKHGQESDGGPISASD